MVIRCVFSACLITMILFLPFKYVCVNLVAKTIVKTNNIQDTYCATNADILAWINPLFVYSYALLPVKRYRAFILQCTVIYNINCGCHNCSLCVSWCTTWKYCCIPCISFQILLTLLDRNSIVILCSVMPHLLILVLRDAYCDTWSINGYF